MGWNTKRIAEKLQVSERVVYEDQRFIEKHADEIMRDYLSNTVPHIVNRSLQRLELINSEAWKILEKTEDKRTRLSAMQVIGKTAIDSVTIVAGIRELVDFALDKDKYMASITQNSSSQNEQENNKQSDQQTESEVVVDTNNDSHDSFTDSTEGETESEEQHSESE